jgi:DNA-binding transcriptional LysR family regulator
MELRHLRYFVAVAEELHFGHAASRLHLSQSSLSQQVRNLESELKVDLLTRTRRQVELTPAGRRFLQEARAILAAAERATGRAREAARGEARKLAIGISPDTDWLLLGKALRLFAEHDSSVEVLFQTIRHRSWDPFSSVKTPRPANELRRSCHRRAASAEAAPRPREKKAPGRRVAAQGAKGRG